MENLPWASAVVVRVDPLTVTVAKGTASPLSFLTVPVMVRTWAIASPQTSTSMVVKAMILLMCVLVYCVKEWFGKGIWQAGSVHYIIDTDQSVNST
jgi:hypothetical protein